MNHWLEWVFFPRYNQKQSTRTKKTDREIDVKLQRIYKIFLENLLNTDSEKTTKQQAMEKVELTKFIDIRFAFRLLVRMNTVTKMDILKIAFCSEKKERQMTHTQKNEEEKTVCLTYFYLISGNEYYSIYSRIVYPWRTLIDTNYIGDTNIDRLEWKTTY